MAKTGLARLLAGLGVKDREAVEEQAARLAVAAKAAEDDDENAEGNEDDDENAEGDDEEDENAEGEDEEDENAEGEDEEDEGKSKSKSKSATGRERARIAAIMNAPAAKGRDALARHLALETAMAPKAAIAALKASPAGGKGRLAAAMDTAAQPNLGPGGAAGARKDHDWGAVMNKINSQAGFAN